MYKIINKIINIIIIITLGLIIVNYVLISKANKEQKIHSKQKK